MKLKFCGAAQTVTGSCYLLSTENSKVLVDCGMRQGSDKKTEFGEDKFAFEPKEIDAILLTHAHIDHSGLIPLAVKKGFKGKIITTEATAQLATIMLPDSGHIQEMEAEYQNRKNLRSGKPTVEPLYTMDDVKKSLEQFAPVPYKKIVNVTDDISVRFVDAGHLLGSASIEITVNEDGKEVKLAFSGDIGREESPIICDPEFISNDADYIIMEGTYGDRDHGVNSDEKKRTEFAAVLNAALRRGGNIIIPSFAVGRTQTILFYLRNLIDSGEVPGLEKIPVYVDSPLGIEATNVFESCGMGYYDEETKALAKAGKLFNFENLKFSRTADESKSLNITKERQIIISSSGMCDAGRIRHHLKHNLYRADSTVIFSGYQAEGTLGRLLLSGARKVKIFGEEIRVNAAIVQIEGFSGHAGKAELTEWLESASKKPKRVFLSHGEADVLSVFSQTLKDRGFAVEVPALLDEFELDANEVQIAQMEKVEKAYKLENFSLQKKKLFKQAERIASLLEALNESDDELTGLKLKIMEEDLKSLADKWKNILNT
ncbi:MAG: MBL fold metallo-hydrolase [Clostridia bacterium]|nr:MBL fold metallo-hydrolase [Clostridia bacterium]